MPDVLKILEEDYPDKYSVYLEMKERNLLSDDGVSLKGNPDMNSVKIVVGDYSVNYKTLKIETDFEYTVKHLEGYEEYYNESVDMYYFPGLQDGSYRSTFDPILIYVKLIGYEDRYEFEWYDNKKDDEGNIIKSEGFYLTRYNGKEISLY